MKEDDIDTRPQMSESVYRDAVTKLRILLEATEAASDLASRAEVDAEQTPPTKLRQVNFVGSVDRNLHQIRGRDSNKPVENDFMTADRKHPRFVKNKPVKSGVRRALFIDDDPDKMQDGKRYNSWHNLAYPGGDVSTADEEPTLSRPAGELRSLIERQELYISQLEKETRFCREQLGNVLAQVQESFPRSGASGDDAAAQSLKVFQKMMAEYANLSHSEDVQRLKLENEMLRKKCEGFEGTTFTNSLIEKLKKDNSILLQSLHQVRLESEENCQREAEAVEQVKRSVQAAEQARMEKHELEFEIEQLKMQIDRQQVRIRGLIEDQATKIEEERIIIDRRFQDQLRQVREEAEAQAGEIGRLIAELERHQRLEGELRRQLKDREHAWEDIQQETEKRVGQLQLELVNMNSSRQQLEQKVGSLQLELDGTKQELRSHRGRHEAELDSIRGRLKRTEDQLVTAREETLILAEAKAALERETNLQKLQIQHLQSLQADQKVIEVQQISAVQDVDNNADRFVVNKLKDLVARQSKLIAELRKQCLVVTDKLETTWLEAQKEVAQLQAQLDRVTEDRRRSLEEVMTLQSQCKEVGSVYEKSVRRLETLEIDYKRSCEEIERLKRDLATVSKEKAIAEQDLSTLQRRKTEPRHKVFSPEKIRAQAIVTERDGKLSSPFIK